MNIQFFDYRKEVKNALKSQVAKFLEEAGGLVESKAKDNTRVESSQTKNSWTHVVEGNRCTIGNPLENAVWEEFGKNPVPNKNWAKSVFKLLLNYGIILFDNNEVRLNFLNIILF